MRRDFLIGVGLMIAGALAGLVRSDAQSHVRDGSFRYKYAGPDDDRYKSPIQMSVSRDGSRLFVVCERGDEIAVIDTAQNRVVRTIKVGRHPFGITFSPDERRIYVSNREENAVSVVDVETGKTLRSIPVGDDPHGLVTDTSGQFLFVTNLGTDDLSVIDTQSFKEVNRLQLSRSPISLARSPDGRLIYMSHVLSRHVPERTPPVLELSVIDVKRQVVVGRRDLFGAAIGQGIAVSPDNRFVVTAHEIPKNLLPETQVYQGWMVTHGFTVAEAGPRGRAAALLLDEPHLYFADPYGVVFSPDGRRLYISSSGVNVVSVLDVDKVLATLEVRDGKIGLGDDQAATYARNLALSSEYVVARIPTRHNPKDLAISPDGKRLYIADRLSDVIQVIDTATNAESGLIDLGGPKIETLLRKGERLFNYSSISFQKQLSCNTCHPEYHVDGLQYDIVAPEEGMGRSIVDNRTMRGIADTGPFKWTGKNPTIARQDGPRAAQLFFRSHGFEKEDLEATSKFIESIPLRKNRYASSDGRLNEFQRRGKVYFERAYTRDGRYIPVANRCITCHPAPYFTDHQVHDVGVQRPTDDTGEFDTPQISNVYENAPFLHDGRCYSLEEIWTVHNLGDTHGATNDMAKENLNDLIEYIKTLSAAEPVSDKDLFASLFAKSKAGTFRLKISDLDATVTPKARYVGNEVCGQCHTREYKMWLGTRHARTWVMLGMTELAPKIASNYRMTAMPQNSGVCLKCHGTASNTPAEFRADTFHVEDGVQCERCHGPGEKYATEEVMKDRKKAMSMGLILPTRQVCMDCHVAKPSHQVLDRKPFDFDTMYKKIVHAH